MNSLITEGDHKLPVFYKFKLIGLGIHIPHELTSGGFGGMIVRFQEEGNSR